MPTPLQYVFPDQKIEMSLGKPFSWTIYHLLFQSVIFGLHALRYLFFAKGRKSAN